MKNWTQIIQDLIDSGMTQVQIAESVNSGQSHISCLYCGSRKSPGWQLGDALLRLHKERRPDVFGESPETQKEAA